MDVFEQLPVELVLLILHQTGDFLGVDSLLQVSPHVHAVFQSYPIQIIENLLASCPTTAHELHHLFRLTALIHSPSFSPANFEELTTAIAELPTATIAVSSRLNDDTARLMISIAAETQRLACACLSIAWDHFKAAHRTILPEEWQTHCEPFSWIEGVRVYRALWQLRIYSDLWNLICPETPMSDPSEEKHQPPSQPPPCANRKWTWPADDANKITTLAIFDISPIKSYEIHSVADLLRHLGAKSLRDAETPGRRDRHIMPPLPLFASLHVPNITQYTAWQSPPVPTQTTLESYWDRSPDYASGGSTQARFYVAMQLNLAFRPGHCPTGLDDMRPFYPLGVFLWDKRRMYLMGFLNLQRYGPKEQVREEERMVQAPDGKHFTPPLTPLRVLQKRWCALVGRKTGGLQHIQEAMEHVELF
ncbi:hypothetical protein BJX63DRAFT_437899 [Aspergillus granulosus]|uniref:F-box domain-containing protein n=1 Tax=Aspergillus granulosus TaxID=176169 RepID=A0ABR4GTM5_9EURO